MKALIEELKKDEPGSRELDRKVALSRRDTTFNEKNPVPFYTTSNYPYPDRCHWHLVPTDCRWAVIEYHDRNFHASIEDLYGNIVARGVSFKEGFGRAMLIAGLIAQMKSYPREGDDT